MYIESVFVGPILALVAGVILWLFSKLGERNPAIRREGEQEENDGHQVDKFYRN